MISTIRNLLLLVLTVTLLSSCNKYVLFSHSGTTDSKTTSETGAAAEKILQPEDRIAVSIWGHEDLSIGSVHNNSSVSDESGKWVMIDANGEVELPQIGKIKLADKSVPDAVKALTAAYAKYITDPVINLRVMSNMVTVLGEVQRPGNYYFNSGSIRLTEALGKSAGLTDFAKSTTIKIIRGKDSFVIDLTNAAYNETRVIPGDVVYVPPTKGKKFDRVVSKILPFASLITAIALIYNISNN